MKIKELRSLGNEELAQKERSFRKELYELNCQRKAGRVEKPGRFMVLKRAIAQILTILKEREIDGTKSQ